MTIGRWLLVWSALAMSVGANPLQARETAKITLAPTGMETAARGKASFSVAGTTRGRFDVGVQRLGRDSDYDLLVGGVKVLTLRTRRGGSAKARFTTTPRGSRDVVLGFDPRGAAIEIRDTSGDDVLIGTLPGGSTGDDPDAIVCCVPDDDRTECEDRKAETCAALGGTVAAAASCLPDPCGSTPPVDRDVVCCIPDNGEPDCEDRTQADCLAVGGSLIEAPSCAANPCAGAPPPPNDRVQCCVPDDPGFVCEDRTIAECAAIGGIGKGPGSCAPNPCGDLVPIPTPTPTPLPTSTPTATPTSAPTDPSCADHCWTGFLGCLNGCTSTYCAPFCQYDLGRCLDGCPP